MAGRPTDYNQEIADLICKRITEGESLLRICKDDDMPSRSTVHRWLLDDDKQAFRDKYEFAINVKAEKMFDELTDIADDGKNDFMEREVGGDGKTVKVVNTEHIQRSRLRVDTRKWYLSKVLPKKFGDKLDHTSGGEKLPTPILANIPTNVVPIHNSDEEDTESD